MLAPESMDAVFQALAHEHRRRILDIVREAPGCSVNDVCSYFETSRIAVMKHLRVLEEANLLASDKKGRTKHLYFNAIPIQAIYDRWTTEYSAFWASRLMDIKYRIESGDVPSTPRPESPESKKKTKGPVKGRSGRGTGTSNKRIDQRRRKQRKRSD